LAGKKAKREVPAVAPPTRKGSKEEVKPPSRSERAAAVREQINTKSKGHAQIIAASDYVLPYLTKRIPTGLLTLDIVLRGGLPCGGLTQIIGRRNAGKDWLMWQCIKQLQYMLGDDMHALLAMNEHHADRSQARLGGVKISMGQDYIDQSNKARENMGLPPFTKEEEVELLSQIGTIDELHASTAEDFYDSILRAVEDSAYHIIVINSIGNIMSAAAAETESVHDKTYAGAAGPNTVFLQKLTSLLTMRDKWGRVRDTCILAINQIRDNIADPNKAYKAPGGKALEHAKLLDIYVESGAMLGQEEQVLKMTNEGLKKTGVFQAWGKQVNWRIEKGKAGMHEGERGTYVYDFRLGNADFYTDTIIAGLTYGVIQGQGWYNIPDPTNPENNLLRVQGRDNLIKALAEDAKLKAEAGDPHTLMNFIRDECFRRAGININYEWEDQ
jgi:RecA/RadA recombinase